MSRALHESQPAAPGKSRSWSLAASGSSIVSALLASVCCVGMPLLALLGVGGAGLLVALGPYQPYFVALTFALLSVGFYFAYCKPTTVRSTAGTPARACPTPAANRTTKIVLWFATALAASLLAFPVLASYLFDR